jgi:hypothetical protein
LQQVLRNVIQLQAVKVDAIDSTLQVTVQYVVRTDQQVQTAQFSREI